MITNIDAISQRDNLIVMEAKEFGRAYYYEYTINNYQMIRFAS